MTFEGWKTPATDAPLERVDRVELFALPQEYPERESWPPEYLPEIEQRHAATSAEAQEVVRLFGALVLDEPARCHMPPWGVAFYEGETLLMTTSLCFRCCNAYVDTATGRKLRAFDPREDNATALYDLLARLMPLAGK